MLSMHASIARMQEARNASSRALYAALVPIASLATLCFVGATLGFGAAMDGDSPLAYPVSTLGALRVRHAGLFNVLAFDVPGLLMAVVAMALYLRLPASVRMARIGAWTLLFSTLAFAAEGVVPLDLDDLDAATSRLHVMSWSLWWLTSGVGVVLLAWGLQHVRPRRLWSMLALMMGLLVPCLTLGAPAAWGSAVPERLAYLAWFGGWQIAARGLSRNAVSGQGS